MLIAALAAWAALGLGVAQDYWSGLPAPSCPHTYVAVIVGLDDRNPIAAGQYVDPGGNCIIWLDAKQNRDGRVVCKRIVHEAGHLRGLPHSTDRKSVMYSPFNYNPVPRGCRG